MSPAEWLAATRRTITYRLVVLLVDLWANRQSWHERDAAQFSRTAGGLIRAAQRTMADAVSTAFVETARDAGHENVRPVSLPDRDVIGLRGVPAEEVYYRPFREVWESLSEGETLADAVEVGRQRLEAIADADLQMAHAEAAHLLMDRELPRQGAAPTYWLRIPQGDYTCALCLIASTQRYNINVKPQIHPACDCTVEPQYGEKPELHLIDVDLLEQVHAAIKRDFGFDDRTGRTDLDYREILVDMTETHGEMGEMLIHPRRGAKKRLEEIRGADKEAA